MHFADKEPKAYSKALKKKLGKKINVQGAIDKAQNDNLFKGKPVSAVEMAKRKNAPTQCK